MSKTVNNLNHWSNTAWPWLAQAAAMDDLDDACAHVQGAMGIIDGGFAGAFFSGPNEEEWADRTPEERAFLLLAYVENELEKKTKGTK